MKTILFLNHKVQNCGVYQYGYRTAQIITRSKKYNIKYREVESLEEYQHLANNLRPKVIIYNYYPSTMPWINHTLLDSKRNKFKQIAIFHEVPLTGFDYYICVDPTDEFKTLYNWIDFSVGRPLIDFETEYKNNNIPIIGSFGFGMGNNQYWNLVKLVNSEFDKAVINLHISFGAFGDKDGKSALSIAEECRKLNTKLGIQLNITHNFMPVEKLLKFLARNTLNAFIYADLYGRGPSSTIDYALSVKRPIAINKSYQFRHLQGIKPSIYVEESSLTDIIKNGIKPLEKFYKMWASGNLIKDYEDILDKICL